MQPVLALLVLVSAATASEWIVLPPPLHNGTPISMMMSIDCPSTANCFFTGGPNPRAMGVYHSQDEHFRKITRLGDKNLNHMLLGLAMESEKEGVTGGFGSSYTTDGLNWSLSTGAIGMMQTQAMYSLGKGKFAFITSEGAEMPNGGGVAISSDGGKTYKGYKPFEKLETPADASARYGAFPSDKTWYVSGGSWPDGKGAKYTAVIAKTSDEGATWELQYNSTGEFYFNQIDCFTEFICMAVAEGSAKDGSSNPGAHVFGTTDGGKTWNEIQTLPNGSGMTVDMVSESEAWIGGASDSAGVVSLLHTTDYGKTFSHHGDRLRRADGSIFRGVRIIDMDFVNKAVGYAVAVDRETQRPIVLAYGVKAPPSPGPSPPPSPDPSPPSPRVSFTHKNCADAKCSANCQSQTFQQGDCIQMKSGGSAKVSCTKDNTEVSIKKYKSTDCTGTALEVTGATDTCSSSPSGGSYVNSCASRLRRLI